MPKVKRGKKTLSKRDFSMKRSNYFIIGIIFIAMILPFSAHAAKVIGKITRLVGTAQILREAVPSPITVTLGMPRSFTRQGQDRGRFKAQD